MVEAQTRASILERLNALEGPNPLPKPSQEFSPAPLPSVPVGDILDRLNSIGIAKPSTTPASVGGTSNILTQLETPSPNILDRLARIGAETIQAGAEGFGDLTKNPLGLSQESSDRLRAIGLFPKKGTLNPTGFLVESIFGSVAVPIDTIGRAFEAGARGISAGFRQAAIEVGLDKTGAVRLERDIFQLINNALLLAGANPLTRMPSVKGPKEKAVAAKEGSLVFDKDKLIKDTDLLIDESYVGTENALLREQLKTNSRKAIEEIESSALLAKANEKIISRDQAQKALRDSSFTHMQKAVIETIDAFRSIKYLAESEAKSRGVAPDLSPYVNMRLTNGIEGMVKAVRERGTIERRSNGDFVFNGKGLEEVFEPVLDDITTASSYFVGKRAAELMKRGIETPFAPEEISIMIQAGAKNPKVVNTSKEHQAFNTRLLNFAEQGGILNAKSKANLLEAGKDFVPFYRIVTDVGDTPKIKGSVFKRIKGGTAPINEPFENIAKNMTMIVDATVKNIAKQSVYDMIDLYDLRHIAIKLKRPPKEAIVADAKTRAYLQDLGIAKPDTGTIQVLQYSRPIADNVDVVYRNGKAQYYEIKDPVFLKSMQALTPEGYGTAIRILAGFSNVFRRSITLSPDFQIRNVMRDAQTSFLQSNAQARPLVEAFNGLASVIAKDENYWLNFANGGGFSTLYKGETVASRTLAAQLKKDGILPKNILDTPEKIADFLEEITSILEQSTRQGEFNRSVATGQNLRQSAYNYREVSTDFAGRGANEFVRNFMATAPFLNARLQSIDKLVRVGKASPGQVALKGILALTIPSLSLYVYNKNNPDYQALSDITKDLSYVLPHPSGKGFVTIPVGFELGFLFKTVPERIFQAIETRHGKKFTESLLFALTNTFAVQAPKAIDPLLQAGVPATRFYGFNTKFTGAPVIPEDLKKVAPSEQFRPWTSATLVETAKLMRDELGVEISPLQVEELFKGYLGVLGTYALTASDVLVRSLTGKIAPEARYDEMPVLHSFFVQTPLRGTQMEQDFYDLLNASREMAFTVNKIVQEGREADVLKLTEGEKEQRLLSLRKSLENIQNTSGKINKAFRIIADDPKLSAKEKLTRMDALRRQRNEMFSKLATQSPDEIRTEYFGLK